MIHALVLAAGAGERMGAAKPLLRWRDRSFVAHVVAAVRDGGCTRAWVVQGAWPLPVEELGDATVVAHPGWAAGPFTSLQAGVRAISTTPPGAVLVASIDRPHLRVQTVAALIEAWRREPAAIWQPLQAGRRGHPVLLPWSAAAHALVSPAVSLRELMAALPHPRRTLASDDPAVLDNIDTPEDLARLLAEDGSQG